MIGRSGMVPIVTAMSFVLATASAVQAQPDGSHKQSMLRLKNQMDTAVNEADRVALWKARQGLADLAGALDAIGNLELITLTYYYTGYVDYRLSSLFEDINEDQKEEFLDEAIGYLEKTIELSPEFAEAWALLGSCYGMQATGLFSGMKYGPKSDRAIGRALELAPDNPRAVMINGIGLLYKPAMFGGSTNRAIDEFRKAGTSYRTWSSPGRLYPDWGEAENYAWMAQAYIELKQPGKARQAYGLALDVDPDYYWVKEVLLPELEAKLN